MGRTKDLLRDNIPFSPGSFGSMEEFAAAIGWDLSTRSTSASSNTLQDSVYESVVELVTWLIESDVVKKQDRETTAKLVTKGLYDLGVFKESEV